MILLRLISWPYFRKHILRTLLTMAGIVLGVAVFVGMHTANQSVLFAFNHTVDRIAGKTATSRALFSLSFASAVAIIANFGEHYASNFNNTIWQTRLVGSFLIESSPSCQFGRFSKGSVLRAELRVNPR